MVLGDYRATGEYPKSRLCCELRTSDERAQGAVGESFQVLGREKMTPGWGATGVIRIGRDFDVFLMILDYGTRKRTIE